MLASSSQNPHVVVRLAETVSAHARLEIQNAGITLLDYLGSGAYFARLEETRYDPARIAALPVLTAEPIQPSQKLHPLLAAGQVPTWAQVAATPQADPFVGAYVLFHRDVSARRDGAAVLARYQADVRVALDSINALVVELPFSAIFELAGEDAVQWIEPALPRFSTTNVENRALTQADVAQSPPYNLDGAGVTVLVYDGGTARASHNDFSGRLTVLDASGMLNHSTHVAGTIGGDGSAGGGLQRGMAPGVELLSAGFQWDNRGTFLYTNPGDIESDYTDAIALGADIANNSIGTNTATNGFPCEITGDYGITSSVIDAIVRGSLSADGSPFRVIWANGNERQTTRCGDTYATTAPPAGAKNHITVGALNADSDDMTFFSSWGPVDDGRLKPDLSAPGCQVGGDGGVTSPGSASDTAYSVLCGTSMASPTVSGLCALILQDYRAQFPGSPDPRNSTLKALLAHTAIDRGNAGPDYQFGYGSVRVRRAVDFLRLAQFVETEVVNGDAVEFRVEVAPGDAELKLMLAWDDFPGTPNVSPALVNDLDLVAVSPGGATHLPWTLDPANPAVPAVRTQADHLNNIEQVLVDNPAPGTWTVRVVGFDVPEGPQAFSLTSSGPLTETGLRIRFPAGVPSVLAPGIAATFDVSITSDTENIVAGSETLHARYDGGAFLSIPLIALGGGAYSATLPPPVCGAAPEFFVSAAGDLSGTISAPATSPFSAVVQTVNTSFADDFESEMGWSAGQPGDTASRGVWNRMDPEGTAAQPEDDHSSAGTQCFVTDGVAGGSLGAFDVDGGFTTLLSPRIDLSTQSDPDISYWRWFSNNQGASPSTDVFQIDISDDDGATWTSVETVGPDFDNAGGWIFHTFRVTDFAALTSRMRMRFIAADEGSGSIVEAALDDFQVVEVGCDTVLNDCNGNGIVDADDIASGRSADANGDGVPDECAPPNDCPADLNGDRVVDLSDLSILLSNFGRTGVDPADGDIDGDNDVDLADLSVLLAAFGMTCP